MITPEEEIDTIEMALELLSRKLLDSFSFANIDDKTIVTFARCIVLSLAFGSKLETAAVAVFLARAAKHVLDRTWNDDRTSTPTLERLIHLKESHVI